MWTYCVQKNSDTDGRKTMKPLVGMRHAAETLEELNVSFEA